MAVYDINASKADNDLVCGQQQQQQQQQQHKQLPQKLHAYPLHDFHHHEYTINNCITNGNNCANESDRSRSGCYSRIARRCKGSIYLAFLSHMSFIAGCLFYIKLSLLNRAWIHYTMVENDLTPEIINTDDDVSWLEWTNQNQGKYGEPLAYLQTIRLAYGHEYATWCTLGASLFALVGALDWLRYCDNLNIFMILAGLAGVISGNSKSSGAAAVWDAISVHLFFLESITLLKRVHNIPTSVNVVNTTASMVSFSTKEKDCEIVDVGDHYVESSPSDDVDGLNGICGSGIEDNGIRDAATYMDANDNIDAFPFFRVGDLFFFLGSMLDVVGSYIKLAGLVGIWFAYTDLVSCFLWLGCALLAVSEEIFYLQKQVAFLIENGKECHIGCFHCY